MNKIYIPLIACVALFSSCLKKEAEKSDGTVIVDRYATTKSYQISAPAQGEAVQVIYHDADGRTDTLATTTVALTLQIPAWIGAENIVTRAAVAPPVSDYLEIVTLAQGAHNFEANSYVKDGNSVIMFEDSRVGDFDYNDLVLYVRHSVSGNGSTAKITFRIKPVALGSANLIAFGWEDGNGEHMLSDDVRRDFFFGQEGFINTENDNTPYTEVIPVVEGGGNTVCDGYTIVKDRSLMERPRYEKASEDVVVCGYFQYNPVATTCSSSSNETKMIKYFIKSGGYKFYVSSIDKSAPEGTFPYGLAIANSAYHAYERTPVWEAYPDFKSWIATGAPLNWSSNRNKALCYEKHVNFARW